jgi:hypothetical protein
MFFLAVSDELECGGGRAMPGRTDWVVEASSGAFPMNKEKRWPGRVSRHARQQSERQQLDA